MSRKSIFLAPGAVGPGAEVAELVPEHRMLKTELHVHTNEDPKDLLPYTTEELIDRAAELGYQALAITLHDRQADVTRFRPYARERGITLIPGVERTIRGKHVLLLNFPDEAERVTSLDEVAELKRRWPGLVIAPHPFYPAPNCLGRMLERHAAVFDAVELNYFYTAQTTFFNDAACRWAARHGKPVVANSDVHRLVQLGPTYTLVDAEPDPHEICSAIRAGRVEIRTAPISVATAVAHFVEAGVAGIRGRLRPAARPIESPLSRHPAASRAR